MSVYDALANSLHQCAGTDALGLHKVFSGFNGIEQVMVTKVVYRCFATKFINNISVRLYYICAYLIIMTA